MYEPFEARIKEWLKEDLGLSAAGVLQRLKEIDPARFEAKNIRMVQRLVKTWRMEMAGLVILDGGWICRRDGRWYEHCRHRSPR